MDDVLEDLENLVNLRVTGEQGLSRAHLRKDAAHGPHVHTGRVLPAAEQDLGGAVPERHDLVGVRAQRDAKGAGEAKVSKLEIAVSINKQILRLEIAMQHAVRVAVADALAEMEHELLDDDVAQAQTGELCRAALGQGLSATAIAHRQCLHVLLEIKINELAHEVELVAVGVDDVVEAHDVGMLHFLEKRNFADGRAGNTLIFGLEADLLQGYQTAAVGEIAGLVDHTIGSCDGG